MLVTSDLCYKSLVYISIFPSSSGVAVIYSAVRNEGDATHAVILSNAKNLAGIPGSFAALRMTKYVALLSDC
ncbi:hypothetical protein [Polaromonas sp.]|uniref:hypothetical protein n=1 Tax=Polaromonas sp. TaxID=1869339 RepID=UPI002FCC1476